MTVRRREAYRGSVQEKALPGRAGLAGGGLPLVRLTLALRDAAEFEASCAGRLEKDGLFVTTPRTREAGERVRLRVELVSGATVFSGEVVVTGAGREGGRTGFWVRHAPGPALTPPPMPAMTPPPIAAPTPAAGPTLGPPARSLTPPPRAAPTPTPPPRAAAPSPPVAPVDDETSFAGVLTVDDDDVIAIPSPTPVAAPPPLPARRSPSRPDLSAIFAEEDDDVLLEDPLHGGLPLGHPVPVAAGGDEEWVEGGLASMELTSDDEGLDGI
jgi:hypothetical protein